ncbi:MAG TPA: hypothetical protein VGY56_14265 [Verrucomicrobiae bacterium]|nr:hypothetical protein [Verrucomicrobiae bacterium]
MNSKINSLAVGGGDIFASIQDAPPDIVNQVNEYTTSGSLVMSGLFPGVGGHLALDGQGHLLVDSYGDGTINAHTTSGALLQSDVISGAGGAEDMVAIPVPEPAVTGQLAVGAVGIIHSHQLTTSASMRYRNSLPLIPGWASPKT